MNDLAIPKFLQRNQTENTMQHTPEKKTRAPRQKIELPNTITIGLDADEYVKIDTLDIAQLVEHSKRINTILASVPRLELERRAIRRAIIQKA